MLAPPYLTVIVDDERMNLEIIAKHLKLAYSTKLKVEKFAEVEAATEFIDSHDVRMVFSDLSMPGVHGLDFTRKLVKAERGIQCVVITGDISYSSALECALNGVQGFITKPITREAVQKITDRCVANIEYWHDIIAKTSGI